MSDGISQFFSGGVSKYFGTGKTISGAGAPASTTGADGDTYIDVTNLLIYGPKAAGAWGAGRYIDGAREVVFGANMTGGVPPRYMFAGGSASVALLTPCSLRLHRACTAVAMYIEATPGIGTGGYQQTLQTLDSAHALTPTSFTLLMPAVDRSASYVGSLSLAAGQRIAVSSLAVGTVSSAPVAVALSLLLIPN